MNIKKTDVTLQGHSNTVLHLTFSFDGVNLASSSVNKPHGCGA